MDSSQENLDLFAEDHESLGQLVDRLDHTNQIKDVI